MAKGLVEHLITLFPSVVTIKLCAIRSRLFCSLPFSAVDTKSGGLWSSSSPVCRQPIGQVYVCVLNRYYRLRFFFRSCSTFPVIPSFLLSTRQKLWALATIQLNKTVIRFICILRIFLVTTV